MVENAEKVAVRESNLFFGFLHWHKGLTYNTPYTLSKWKWDGIEDLFFSYFFRLSDWEKYCLLEMFESGRWKNAFDNEYWSSSADKEFVLFYRRYKNIPKKHLQQWMVDELKGLLLSRGLISTYPHSIPNDYQKWFIVPSFHKTLNATKEFQSGGSKKTVRKNGYRWDEYFPQRTVGIYLNVLQRMENEKRKENGTELLDVDWRREEPKDRTAKYWKEIDLEVRTLILEYYTHPTKEGKKVAKQWEKVIEKLEEEGEKRAEERIAEHLKTFPSTKKE